SPNTCAPGSTSVAAGLRSEAAEGSAAVGAWATWRGWGARTVVMAWASTLPPARTTGRRRLARTSPQRDPPRPSGRQRLVALGAELVRLVDHGAVGPAAGALLSIGLQLNRVHPIAPLRGDLQRHRALGHGVDDVDLAHDEEPGQLVAVRREQVLPGAGGVQDDLGLQARADALLTAGRLEELLLERRADLEEPVIALHQGRILRGGVGFGHPGEEHALLPLARQVLPGLFGGEAHHRRQQAQQGLRDLQQDRLGAAARVTIGLRGVEPVL